MKVYIGYDDREDVAYNVAKFSIERRASIGVDVTPLNIHRLESSGIIHRRRTTVNGQSYDSVSSAPMSTQFAISRFLTPILAQSGWALFMDCDVVVLDDVAKLLDYTDDKYAVMCVKHDMKVVSGTKMDGQAQTPYSRKNWSSVMMFNCDHASNRKLTLDVVNTATGLELHGFSWLKDDEIGDLPSDWNWLVGVQEKPVAPKLAHFTLGGPWFDGWEYGVHDRIWDSEYTAYKLSVLS